MENQFDWYVELYKAIENEPNIHKYVELNRRSCQWVTCACGQLCQKLPRTEIGEPRDTCLANMGLDFSIKISERKWVKAKAVLDNIEARTTYLLKQLGS